MTILADWLGHYISVNPPVNNWLVVWAQSKNCERWWIGVGPANPQPDFYQTVSHSQGRLDRGSVRPRNRVEETQPYPSLFQHSICHLPVLHPFLTQGFARRQLADRTKATATQPWWALTLKCQGSFHMVRVLLMYTSKVDQLLTLPSLHSQEWEVGERKRANTASSTGSLKGRSLEQT